MAKDKVWPRITSAHISKAPTSFYDPLPQITVYLDDDSHQVLFSYDPEKFTFTEDEFVGLTMWQAYELRRERIA